MKKQIYLLLLSLTVMFSSCFSFGGGTKTPPQPKYSPKFDYTPANRQAANSAGITVALLSPKYANNDNSYTVAPYSTFLNNMGDDFEEMLIAKGVRIKGPFVSRDEMVYSDKKNSDMALKVSIDLNPESGTLTYKQQMLISKSQTPAWKMLGNYYLQGKVILEIVDPYNGEKFWKKSVSLPRQEVNILGEKYWYTKNVASILARDNGVYNPIALALEKYYANALQTAFRHLDVEELKQIKKEIAKAQKENRK